MKTRKRSSCAISKSHSCGKIHNKLDYSAENLSLNFATVWHTSHDKTHALITAIILKIQQGVWFTILPTSEYNLGLNIGVRQDCQHIQQLFLHVGLTRIIVKNNIRIYTIIKAEWETFIAQFPQEMKLHLSHYRNKISRNKE